MVNRAIIAEAAENVLSTDETLKASIEGYADRWGYAQYTFRPRHGN